MPISRVAGNNLYRTESSVNRILHWHILWINNMWIVQLGPWSAIVNLPHNLAYSDQGRGILYYADIYKTKE